MKVNCEALEPWQGSHAETRPARAEPSDRSRSCPGWLLGSLPEGPVPPEGISPQVFETSRVEMNGPQEMRSGRGDPTHNVNLAASLLKHCVSLMKGCVGKGCRACVKLRLEVPASRVGSSRVFPALLIAQRVSVTCSGRHLLCQVLASQSTH